MVFELITSSNKLWEQVKEYASTCSWSAGKALANNMEANVYTDWERVIVAYQGEQICGYCTVSKTDCIPNAPYTPYIGYIFVNEEYRGNRLSQKIIMFAISYLKEIGFSDVYLISDHENLYEKYGLSVVDRAVAPWGSIEKIYHRFI
ncbi:MAG: GNAT family N-acetyltransferase [Clostridia bacterium]|nr:GNAT family N-acetyltransferase [Clostridia bacterium]